MAQDEQDKKGTLINELDSLRHTLNSGPEFQQDIPTLNEQHSSPFSTPHSTQGTASSEQCDLFKDSDGVIHDPDLDVPILTDAYEEQEPCVKPESTCDTETITNEATITQATSELTSDATNDTALPPITPSFSKTLQQAETPEAKSQAPIDVEQLNNETDSSVMELEQVLDELVAEQLPKLEQQLREKLRSELEADVDTKNVGTRIESTDVKPKE